MADPTRYTDDRGVVWVQQGSVAAALDDAIKDAQPRLTPSDLAGLAAARVLARMIDNMSGQAAGVAEDGSILEDVPARPLDNVTIPTFLKYLDAYGLTVSSRKAMAGAAPPAAGAGRGKLAAVRNLTPKAGGA